jgi:hypothetical protein
MMTRRRIITLIIVFFGLSIAIVVGYFIYKSIYSSTINLYFAPKSADVKIGNGGGNFGDNFVKPGTYTVVISKQGFSTYTQEVTVKSGETVTVNAALTSTSSQTADWYDKNAEDYTIAQNVGDRRADQEMNDFVKDFPIVKALPIVGMYESYRVDYGPSPTKTGKFAVFISYQSDAAKQQAIDAVKAKGYNLSDYEVVYDSSALTSGATTFTNTVSLSNRGLSKKVLSKVQDLLAARYPSTTVAFADDSKHIIENEGATHIYTVSFGVSGANHALRVTVTSITTVDVTVDGQSIYSGAVD